MDGGSGSGGGVNPTVSSAASTSSINALAPMASAASSSSSQVNPLSAAVLRGLSDKFYEKRKAAALELERYRIHLHVWTYIHSSPYHHHPPSLPMHSPFAPCLFPPPSIHCDGIQLAPTTPPATTCHHYLPQNHSRMLGCQRSAQSAAYH